MNDIEIFENLIEPIKCKLSEDDYEFIVSRCEIFISQMSSQVNNPIKQLSYTLLNNAVEIMKANEGLVPNELPEVLKIWAAIDIIKPYIESD